MISLPFLDIVYNSFKESGTDSLAIVIYYIKKNKRNEYNVYH